MCRVFVLHIYDLLANDVQYHNIFSLHHIVLANLLLTAPHILYGRLFSLGANFSKQWTFSFSRKFPTTEISYAINSVELPDHFSHFLCGATPTKKK